MKRLVCMGLLVWVLSANAQNDTDFAALLKPVREVTIADSLHIDTISPTMRPLDTIMVKKWFGRIIGATKNNRLRNRDYYLAGKITSPSNFNLLVLLEEKKKQDDSSNVQVVHLVSTKKDGTYIASIEAAMGGIKKRSVYNISSWLYKDLKIVLDSRILTNEKMYEDMMSYRITSGGRFILNERNE